MRRIWLLVMTVAFSVAVSSAESAGLEQQPKRHTSLTQRGDTKPCGISPVEGSGDGLTLDEMWQREIAVAREEADRFLQLQHFDEMSTAPTRAPTSAPVPTAPPSGAGTPGPDSCLGGLTRDEYLFQELSSITDPIVLANSSTAQGRAFQFMVAEDPLQPNVCAYPTLDQRYGLATLAYSTNVNNWTNSENWLQDLPECDWFGVSCENGRVSNLTLTENNLAGTLPNELSTLFEMRRLSLYNNFLVSTIPSGVSNLTQLCVLDLEMNALTGSALPESLLECPMLQDLFLSNNLFKGTIPENITRLSMLENFWVADNQVSGTIPSGMAQLTNLTSVIMYQNMLAGRLEDTPFGDLTRLFNLQLYDNQFSGVIPESFYSLVNLTVLRLDKNFLEGTISSAIGDLTRLTDLRLSVNFFNGTIPETLSNLVDLKYLVLNSNAFSSTVPDVFGPMQQLVTIDLSLLRCTGTIPSSIFSSPVVQEIYLNDNLFDGAIPTEYATPPILVDLFLNNNLLDGTVPPVVPPQLSTLNEFLLQGNLLTGSMPESVCALRGGGKLSDLFADCQGDPPEIVCDFPECCNQCFESEGSGTGSPNAAPATTPPAASPTSPGTTTPAEAPTPASPAGVPTATAPDAAAPSAGVPTGGAPMVPAAPSESTTAPAAARVRSLVELTRAGERKDVSR